MSAVADDRRLDATRNERAVEVILDRGDVADGQVPRYSVGSGHLVGGTRVLTAAHVLGEGTITVRTVSGREYSAVRVGVPAVHDLALLEIRDPSFPPGVPPVTFGEVDRTSDDPVERCSAVGFPRFGERHDTDQGRVVRDTAHLRGVIPPRSHLVGGRLEFEVTATPRALPQSVPGVSEWEGISGSAVCAHHPDHGPVLVGVIVDHERPRGGSSLTLVPVSSVMTEEVWRAQLGLGAAAGFVRLPAVLEIPPSPYRATVRELAQRTGRLLGRDPELARLVQFARGQVRAGYLWVTGPKWWGKTALTANLVHYPPTDLDVVAYFMTPRGDASSERFALVVNDQLARLLGHVPTADTGDLDGFRMRWARAAERAAERRRPLLLVVDGLDDDTSVDREMASVASVLPRETTEWAHVVVTSRNDPSLPADVDPAHPLYDAEVLTLAPPVDQVTWKNRAVEARHGLCPECKRADRAEAITSVVGKGLPAPGTLAATLRLPTPPRHGGWLVLLMLGSIMISAGAIATANAAAGAGALALAVGVVFVVVSWLAIRRSARRAALSRQLWPTLRYCHRDAIVFHPESGDWSYAGQLAYLLGRLVGAAERERTVAEVRARAYAF